MDSYFGQKQRFKVEKKIVVVKSCYVCKKRHSLMDWSLFLSTVWTHSDSTHSLQRIHWWTSNVMLNIYKSVQMKNHKHKYFHISLYLELVLFPTQPKIEFVVTSIPVIFGVPPPASSAMLLGIKLKLCRICRHFSHFLCRFWKINWQHYQTSQNKQAKTQCV